MIGSLAPRYIPIRQDAKIPALRDWPNEASPDPADAHRWLRRGYRLGLTLAGLLVFDFDPGAAIEPFDEEFGRLPPTWAQTTGRGGVHFLYSLGSSAPYRSRVRWRDYQGYGGVDIKTGPGAFIVLYPPEPGMLPTLRGLAPLPEWLADELPRGGGLKSPAVMDEAAWAVLDKSTTHYRRTALTEQLLAEAAERIAAAGDGEQDRTLNSVGFTWGRKVRAGYVGAGYAYFRLICGAQRMVDYDAARPWELEDLQVRLKRAILAGAAAP